MKQGRSPLVGKLLTLYSILSISLFASSALEIAQEAEQHQDFKKAIQYYKKAAFENDNAQAHYKLGIFYYEGKVVKRNFTQTYRSFTKASLLGHTKARYNLGIFYASKRTPYFDAQQAYKIFKELAVQGHAGAQNRIGMYLTFGFDDVIEKDYKKAIQWFEKSSKQGYVNAHCNLAYMYASGKGVWQNMGRAHAFAKEGYKKKNPLCNKVWREFNLQKYPEDKGFKLKFYNQPYKEK